jgi:tetratricopeptide (TPR) repeat protein
LPVFCLSAGYGLSLLQDHFRMAQWRKLAAGLIIVGCGFAVTSFQLIEPFDFSHSFTDEGLAYEMKNEPDKALNSYEKALEINPDYSRALDRLGKLQLQQKEYEGARSTYRKILALDPDSAEAKYQIIFLDTLGSGPEAANK